MICLGKVKGNLMIDLNASNEKRRGRAARMLASLPRGPPAPGRLRLVRPRHPRRQGVWLMVQNT